MQSTTLKRVGLRELPPEDLYTYGELPTPTSIRLVSLKKSSFEGGAASHNSLLNSCEKNGLDPIEISIRVVDLEDYPVYEALSYTWGRPLTVFQSIEAREKWVDDPFPVFCDRKVLPATGNL